MKTTITLKIDVTKIEKARLFKGEKGTYLDAVLFYDTDADQYGQNGMIVQSVTQDERQKGVKGPILGNAKMIGQPQNIAPQAAGSSSDPTDDLPF